MLLGELPRVDGHREVTDTLVTLVKALFGGDPAKGSAGKASTSDTPPAGVMIPELQLAIEARAQALAEQKMADADSKMAAQD